MDLRYVGDLLREYPRVSTLYQFQLCVLCGV